MNKEYIILDAQGVLTISVEALELLTDTEILQLRGIAQSVKARSGADGKEH